MFVRFLKNVCRWSSRAGLQLHESVSHVGNGPKLIEIFWLQKSTIFGQKLLNVLYVVAPYGK